MKLVKTAKLRKRGDSYYAEYTDHHGKRPRPTLGSDYVTAQRLVVKINEWLYEGKDPVEELNRFRERGEPGSMTLRQFHPQFIERHGKRLSRSMQEIFKGRWNNIIRCSELVDIPMSNISKGLVLAYAHARVEEGMGNSTVNREIAMLRNMLNRAVDWDIITHNPIHGIKLLKEKQKREVNLSPEDAEALLDALHPALSNIVEFCIYTGFRKENVLSLRISQVQLSPDPSIRLKVKGNKYISFPIAEQAAEVLRKAIGDRTEGYVFINPQTQTRYYSINRTVDRAIRKLGLEVDGSKLRFHDLRHVFATWLINAGVSPIFVQTLLGHTDIKTTDRYITASMKEAGKALSALPTIRRKS